MMAINWREMAQFYRSYFVEEMDKLGVRDYDWEELDDEDRIAIENAVRRICELYQSHVQIESEAA